MNKLGKSVAISSLSMGLAGGLLALGANVDHVQNQDRRACYERLDGQDQEQCLAEVRLNSNTEQVLEIGPLVGLLGAVAAGVQAYRALAKES